MAKNESQSLWGVRGLAIGLVLFGHLMLLLSTLILGRELNLYFCGRLGVYLFFCLSGFLLGSRYSSSAHQERNWVSEFYRRRLERILPPLIGMMVVYTLLAPFLIGRSFSVREVLIAFSFNTNYLKNTAILEHLWSLAVECQTYLILPLIIYGIRKGIRAGWLDALIASGWIINLWISSQPDTHFTGEETHACIWAILVGVRLGMRPLPTLLTSALMVSTLVGGILLYSTHAGVKVALFGIAYACFAALIIQHRDKFKILTQKPLTFLGRRAYSAYLYQQMVFYSEISLAKRLILAVIAGLLIEASYHWIEPMKSKSKKSAYFLMGVPAIRAIGAGRLLIQLEAENREQNLGVQMIYAGNKSAAADAWRRKKMIAFTLAAIVHFARQFSFRFKLATGYFSRLQAPLLIFHPQEIGSKRVRHLIETRKATTALYLLDSSYFCVRSYNFIPGENDACLRCVGGHFENAQKMKCRPFPISNPEYFSFPPYLREKVRSGKLRVFSQSRVQANLALKHFGGSTDGRLVGMWTVDLEEMNQEWPEPPKDKGFDVVFHGTFQPAKGFDWTLQIAALLPELTFLFPGPRPESAHLPISKNCEFIPMTWESGLRDEVRRSRITLVPSLWSAPIEGALVKSVIEAPAVGVADVPTSFSSEFPDSIVVRLPNDPVEAAAALKNALESSWKPDPQALRVWRAEWNKNRPVTRRILENLNA